MANIPASLSPPSSSSGGTQGKALTVGQRKKIRKYGSLENYERYQQESKEIAALNVAAQAEAKKEYEAKLKEYEAQKKIYDAQLAEQKKEAAEWKQAEKLAGKAQLGYLRYDPRSSVGKKIKAILAGWERKGYGTSPLEKPSKPELPPTGKIVDGVLVPDAKKYQQITNTLIEPDIIGSKGDSIKPSAYGPVQKDRTGQTYDVSTGVYTKPTYGAGAGGTLTYTDITPVEARKIKLAEEKAKKIVSKVESAEASFVPSLTLEKTIYLPDKKSQEKYIELLEGSSSGIFSGSGGYELSEFVKEQEKKLKEDLEKARAYNVIAKKKGQAVSKFKYGDEEVDTKQLFQRLEVGARGRKTYPTGWDILKESATSYETKGKKVSVAGVEVSPTTARGSLMFGTKAYEFQKAVLAYQVAGTTLGLAGVAPTITGTPTGIKAFKIAQAGSNILLGGSVAAYAGVSEYSVSKDFSYSLGAGLGAGTGYFSAIYSKQIVERVAKPFQIFARSVRDMPPISQSKRGGVFEKDSQQEMVEVEYKGKKIKVTKEMYEKYFYQPIRDGKNIKIIGKGTSDYNIKADRFRRLLDAARTSEDVKKIMKAAKTFYGEEFLNEFLQQEGYTDLKPLTTGNIKANDNLYAVPIIFNAGRSSAIETTTQFQPERVGETQWSDSGLLADVTQKDKTKTDSKTKQKQGSVVYQMPEQDTVQKPEQDTVQKPEQDTVQIILQKPITRPAVTQRYVPTGITNIRGGGGGQTEPPVEEPIEIVPPRIIDIRFPGERMMRQRQEQAYIGQVLVKGKYQTVTDKPHTKKGALDKIARIIDNTISSQGRIIPAKKKLKKGTKMERGDDYYNRTSNKFRDFRIIKGKRVSVKNTLIEKRNRRLDTPGETRGLTVAQFKSQGKRGRPFKKNSRTKTPFIL